jgi:type IV pilus assembly protein PilQ
VFSRTTPILLAAALSLVAAAALAAPPAAPAPVGGNALVGMEWRRAPRGGGDALALSFSQSPAPWPAEAYDASTATARLSFDDASLNVPQALRAQASASGGAAACEAILRPLPSGGCEVSLQLPSRIDYSVAREGREVVVTLLGGGSAAPSKGDLASADAAPAGPAWDANAHLWDELDGLFTVERKPQVLAQNFEGGSGQPDLSDLLGADTAVPDQAATEAFLPPIGNPEDKYRGDFAGDSAAATGLVLTDEIARKRIENLRFRETPLQDALRLIASKADLNLLFNPDNPKIKRLITAELKNVALGDALEAILRVNELAAVQEGDIIQIVDREDVVEEKVELDVRVRPLNWVRAKNLETTLEDFVSASAGAQLKSDEESNVIIIKDTQKNIVRLLKLIDKLDIPEKQVMVEMRLVDYNLSLGREQGIDWNLLRPDTQSIQQVNGQLDQLNRAGLLRGGGYEDETENLFSNALINAVDDPVTINEDGTISNLVSLASPAPPIANLAGQVSGLDVDGVGVRAPTVSGSAFSWDWGTDISVFGQRFNLEVALQLLEQRNIVSVLANPRVVTLNNIPAVIEVIRREPYFETTESQAGNVSSSVSFEDIGIRLNVTPNITNNDYVRMKLEPEQFISRGAITSPDGTASAIRVDRRNATTNVIVHDEDTIALGGLRSLERSDNETGVPWVARAPVVGWLFKNSIRSSVKTELMLFVRPKIIKELGLSEQEQGRYDEIDMSWVLPDYFYDDASVVPTDFFEQF